MRAKNACPIIMTLFAAGLFSCGPTSPPSAVRVGVDVDAGTLDPRLARDTTAYRAVNLIYDGLVEIDADLRPVPGLAERWENPEPSVWVFILREEAHFHDGTPVTADDVVYTFESLLDPAFRAPLRSLYAPIQRVEAPDSRTVQFNLSEPYAPLLSYLDMGIVPKHAADTGSQPVGSGPYRLSRWDKGSKIVLDANVDFWGGEPNIPSIELILVPDNTARAQAFEAGDLDIIMSPLSPQDIGRLTENERFRHELRPGLAITYLNFSSQEAHLADPRMRRAITMLVDQPTILEQIYEGTDEAASSILLPSWSVYSEDVKQPTYDPKAARELFADLGWTDSDGDGVLDKDETKLTLELGTHSEDVNRIQTIEFLQNVFSGNGIETEVWISDWPSFSVRRDAGDYEVILLGWTQLVDPDRVSFDQLHSKGGLNWGGYSNPRVDELLERGRASTDLDDRAQAYREAASIIAEEVPYYILSYQGYQAFVHPRVVGFEPDPRGMIRGLIHARIEP
jgi:peptide/nickel transport system substrate-binding protein